MKLSKFKLISVSIGFLIASSMFLFIYLTDQYEYSPPDPTIVETDKNLKIAIIGAGASGLTAAHRLKKTGYKNVTVFERESKAGGKIFSYRYNDHYKVPASFRNNILNNQDNKGTISKMIT